MAAILSAPTWGRELARIVPDQPPRACVARPEVALWVAVVEDAIDCARAVARRRRRLTCATPSLRPCAAERLIAAEDAGLRRWCEEDFAGSLAWIADLLSGAAGMEINPACVRRVIVEALDGVSTVRHRRERAASRGVRRRPVIYARGQ